MEGGLVQVALQGEVAEGFPRCLVGLHLHSIPLHGVVVPDRTACHQRCACQALQILQEERKKTNKHSVYQILASDVARLQGNLQDEGYSADTRSDAQIHSFLIIMREPTGNLCDNKQQQKMQKYIELYDH